MTVDVEALLIAGLAPGLGVPIATQVPNPRPAAFVRLVAAGGPERADVVIDWAHVTWEAWAPSSVAAADLAGRVRDAFDDLAGASYLGVFVAASASTRPRWFPDDTSDTPRYVAQARVLIHAN